MHDAIRYRTTWTIRRYADLAAYGRGEAYLVSEVEGNLLLNAGIALLLSLLTGGAGTPYDEANTYLGVGDSSTAASASQTGLQASSNKAWVAVEAGYPQIAGQTVTWRSVFDGSTANFAWNEFTVVNDEDDDGVNLNRKVEAEGTKTAGQIWTLDLAITFS